MDARRAMLQREEALAAAYRTRAILSHEERDRQLQSQRQQQVLSEYIAFLPVSVAW
jgi:hypothetical protein